MSINNENFDIKNLWHIIPGTIFLVPIMIIYWKKIIYLPNSLLVVLFPIMGYVVGFILHRMYRIIYHILLLYNRSAIIYFSKKFKIRCRKKAEYLYNFNIYSNPPDKKSREAMSKIKTQSVLCSSIFTSFLAFLVGAILLYFNMRLSILTTVYKIMTILFLIDYLCVFAWMNRNEIVLIDYIAELNEEKE